MESKNQFVERKTKFYAIDKNKSVKTVNKEKFHNNEHQLCTCNRS